MRTDARRYPNRHHEDNLTRAGAEALANAIRKYWFGKGKFPNISVVSNWPAGLSGSEGKGGVFGVRSNMKLGMPQESSND